MGAVVLIDVFALRAERPPLLNEVHADYCTKRTLESYNIIR